eukprot:GHVU01048403.1.p1 GENE.GHVU01048403.1~~GHVU01048403.1.p1  ORF type:complete len:232 (+),score=21.16 GHVU01048403.1:215-910(+)
MASTNAMHRSVMVTSASQELSKNRIQIHFQKRRNGGGECDVYKAAKDFLVVFEDKEVADRVLSKRVHVIDGYEVQVRKKLPEIFPEVEATLNADILQNIPAADLELVTTSISNKGLPAPRLVAGRLIFRGTWSQLQTYRSTIETFLQNRQEEKQPQPNLPNPQQDIATPATPATGVIDDKLSNRLHTGFRLTPTGLREFPTTHTCTDKPVPAHAAVHQPLLQQKLLVSDKE